MTEKNFSRFLKNDWAADALPMRIMLTVIVLGAVLILLSGGVHSLLEKEKVYDARAVISEIEAHAEQMSAKGAGSNVTLDINVPSKTMIVMGSIPGSEEKWPADACNYYLDLNGKRTIGKSSAFYSNSTLDGGFVLYPGPHMLNLKSVRDQNGKIFIALSDKSQS